MIALYAVFKKLANLDLDLVKLTELTGQFGTQLSFKSIQHQTVELGRVCTDSTESMWDLTAAHDT